MKDNSKITPELLETVEHYYNGSLKPEQRIPFEQELEKDPDFKLLVEDIRTTLLGIESQALKEQLDEFHKDIVRPQPKNKSSKPRFLNVISIGIAATIVLAIGLFWMNRGRTSERLYDTYFKVDPGLPTTMSTTDNYVFYDGMVNYKQGDYNKAITKWKTLEQNSPDNDTLNYFLGVAQMANDNATAALPYLNKTIEKPESVFIEDAYYFLGLAYLKTNNPEKAKMMFQKSKMEKGKEILEKLD